MPLSDNLKSKYHTLWERMVTHPFVQELGDGTLPREKFSLYFQQDYLFLKDLVALLCAATARSPDYHGARTVNAFLGIILGGEEELFQRAFQGLGLSPGAVGALHPLPTTRAYSSFLAELSLRGTFPELLAALLAIEGTYADWAQRLAQAGKQPADPFYRQWIDIHAGRELADFVDWVQKTLDGCQGVDQARLEEVFHTCLRYEYLFWEMAYRGEKWPD